MAKMRYRVLGISGMKVSELCLGTMMFGGPTDEAEARRIIDHALDSGVNFIDTANVYTKAPSESVIGRGHQGQAQPLGAGHQGRQQGRHGPQRQRPVAAPRHAGRRGQPARGCRPTTSTSTTSTASIPIRPGRTICHLRRPDPRRARSATGACPTSAPGTSRTCTTCAAQLGVPPPAALQPYYNLMNRQPEVELLPAARAFGLGVVPYSPIARGVLTGKYKVNQKAEPAQPRRAPGPAHDGDGVAPRKPGDRREAQGARRRGAASRWCIGPSPGCSTTARSAPSSRARAPSSSGRATSRALDYTWTPRGRSLADSLVVPGHASTPGYNDPQYPVVGRFAAVA